jgi:hypothetical protein
MIRYSTSSSKKTPKEKKKNKLKKLAKKTMAENLGVSESELKRIKKASPRQNKFNTPSYMTTAEKKNFKKYENKNISKGKSVTDISAEDWLKTKAGKHLESKAVRKGSYGNPHKKKPKEY